MFIVPNQDFRHDYGQYKADNVYEVPDALGQYFVNVGWADGYDSEQGALDTDVDPEVQSTGDTTPPGRFRVDKDFNVTETDDEDAIHNARGVSEDLEVQDAINGQETEL